MLLAPNNFTQGPTIYDTRPDAAGKNRPRGAHKEGFVYVTRLGYTNYCFVSLETDLEDWMLWMRTALDMALGVEGAGLEDARAGGISINRETLHRGVLEPPRPEESEVGVGSGEAGGEG